MTRNRRYCQHRCLRAITLVTPLALAMAAHHASFFLRAPHWHGAIEHTHAGGGLSHIHVHSRDEAEGVGADSQDFQDRESALRNTFYTIEDARSDRVDPEGPPHTHAGRTHPHSHASSAQNHDHRHSAPHDAADPVPPPHDPESDLPASYFSALSAPVVPAPALVVSAATGAPQSAAFPAAEPVSSEWHDSTAIRGPPPFMCS